MASDITEVVLKLKDEVNARLVKLESQVGRTGKKIETTFKNSAVNVRAFAQNIKDVILRVKGISDTFGEAAERVLNFGEQFGISTDNVQKLELATKLAGSELESLVPMMSRLAAAQERGALKGRDFFETIQDVAKELNAMPPGAQRAAKAVELFGRGGVRLIPVLAELEQKTKNFKLLSKEELERIDKASDNVTRLTDSLTKLAAVTVTPLSESFVAFLENPIGIGTAKGVAGSFKPEELTGGMIKFNRELLKAAAIPVKKESVLDALTDKEDNIEKRLKETREELLKLFPVFRKLSDEQLKALSTRAEKELRFLGGQGDPEELRMIVEGTQKRGTAIREQEEKLAQDLLEIDKKFIEDRNRVREENERKAQERRDKTAGFGGAKTLAGGIQGFTDQMDLIVSEFENLQKRGAELAIDLASGLGNAFDNLFFNVAEEGFANLTQAARNFGAEVLKMLAQIAIRQATTSLLGGIFGGLGFGFGGGPALAKGGVMSGGIEDTMPVRAFARGGIAREPTMALMGEGRGSRGEAFVPLPDGRSIPVQMQGEGAKAVGVTFNITTLDPRSFREFLVKDKSVIKNLIHEAVSSDKSFRRRIGEPR